MIGVYLEEEEPMSEGGGAGKAVACGDLAFAPFLFSNSDSFAVPFIGIVVVVVVVGPLCCSALTTFVTSSPGW